MNRDEFCRLHWSYYLLLEKDFRSIERYISFDLGDNYLYDSHTITDFGNSNIFSNEFVKQYQAICSEIDVILKSVCRELGGTKATNMPDYTNIILKQWKDFPNQKVKMNMIELQPFSNWKGSPQYTAPDWWGTYNHVKHERLTNFKDANLKNVVNSLAGLYILESYLAKFIGDRDKTKDVPNDISKLFKLVNFPTNDTVVGYESYLMTSKEIEALFDDSTE